MMENPVKLPTSGSTMDFKYIKQMLLNDEWDPINWKPLWISDLIPDEDLKARIETWKQQKWAGIVTDEDKREAEQWKLEIERKQKWD